MSAPSERGLSGKVSGLDREPTAGELGIADGPSDEYRSGPSEPTADLPATLASVDDVRREALALIDDLMRGQEHTLDQPGIAGGWTAGVQWRADRWAELVARRNALTGQNGGDR